MEADQAAGVTPEEAAQQFRAAHVDDIEGTRESVERCVRMLNTYAPDLFPANDKGQVHFARAMMESAADEVAKFLETLPPAPAAGMGCRQANVEGPHPCRGGGPG